MTYDDWKADVANREGSAPQDEPDEDPHMALAAEKLGEPAPAKNADHDWKFLTSHGDDAPGQSKDTYSQCTRCDMVKHDYAHGGGQTSPNYPVYYLAGKTHGAYHDPPCVSLRAEVEDLKRVRDIELGSVAASAEEAFDDVNDYEGIGDEENDK